MHFTPEERHLTDKLTRAERWLDHASTVVLVLAAGAILWAVLDTWSGLPIHARPADRVVLMEAGQ